MDAICITSAAEAARSPGVSADIPRTAHLQVPIWPALICLSDFCHLRLRWFDRDTERDKGRPKPGSGARKVGNKDCTSQCITHTAHTGRHQNLLRLSATPLIHPSISPSLVSGKGQFSDVPWPECAQPREEGEQPHTMQAAQCEALWMPRLVPSCGQPPPRLIIFSGTL